MMMYFCVLTIASSILSVQQANESIDSSTFSFCSEPQSVDVASALHSLLEHPNEPETLSRLLGLLRSVRPSDIGESALTESVARYLFTNWDGLDCPSKGELGKWLFACELPAVDIPGNVLSSTSCSDDGGVNTALATLLMKKYGIAESISKLNSSAYKIEPISMGRILRYVQECLNGAVTEADAIALTKLCKDIWSHYSNDDSVSESLLACLYIGLLVNVDEQDTLNDFDRLKTEFRSWNNSKTTAAIADMMEGFITDIERRLAEKQVSP